MVDVVAEASDEEADAFEHGEAMLRLQQAEHGVGHFECVVPVVVGNLTVIFADLRFHDTVHILDNTRYYVLGSLTVTLSRIQLYRSLRHFLTVKIKWRICCLSM